MLALFVRGAGGCPAGVPVDRSRNYIFGLARANYETTGVSSKKTGGTRVPFSFHEMIFILVIVVFPQLMVLYC